jgi:hypothetical protein
MKAVITTLVVLALASVAFAADPAKPAKATPDPKAVAAKQRERLKQQMCLVDANEKFAIENAKLLEQCAPLKALRKAAIDSCEPKAEAPKK